MRTITASEFKAKCLKLMDEVNETGEPLLVTKNGRPVSKLVPFRERKSLFGAMPGCVTLKGDALAPVGENWEAERDSARYPRAGVARGRQRKARS